MTRPIPVFAFVFAAYAVATQCEEDESTRPGKPASLGARSEIELAPGRSCGEETGSPAAGPQNCGLAHDT